MSSVNQIDGLPHNSVPKKEFNILLLGETGVGKSTFINAFANYLTYLTLTEAVTDELISLIPSKFTVTDDNYEERTIRIGQSENESEEVGASATQNAKSYIFPLDDIRIRLIDTPGIGDTRGAEQDNINFEKLLAYLGEFHEINAICILLKPNNARITVMFEYCIKQLLSRLEKSASQNIIFLFTNSRSTFYRPGDTLPPLRKILDGTQNKPPYVKIPLDKQNIYCIDNESFRFLVAIRQGIQFNQREKDDFASSWTISSEECWRLLTYIAHLKPHKIQDTLSINESRRLIVQLSQPLADIANLIQINITQLERHKEQLSLHAGDVQKLKENLYVPVTNIRVEELDRPRTVCTDLKCCEVFQVNGNKTYHYKQVCHNPCYLRNVPKEIVGSPELTRCAAMNSNQHCKHCGCSYLKHMHIYYQSFTYEDNIVDENVRSQISTKENAKSAAEKVIREIEQRRKEYESEQDTIIKSTAKFAHFLQNNAITAYNDAYQSYLEYLIDREKSLGASCDKRNIDNLQNMLRQYVEEKRALDTALELAKQGNITTTSYITAKDVKDAVDFLYKLPHCGPKIKELFDKQNRAKGNEHYTEREVNFKQTKKNTRLRELKKSLTDKINTAVTNFFY
ncbi:hypothetical protein ILUMI_02432 [Ignelater luminosus]|uniref:DUF8206 domain-containing protein n=1 Tax=Ignelater luminosus TaxID=2038154 RepID=A0A8K0DGG4_IGNLU|nr:hypothetical protein ILUMI_02432 [Ignelater luminosus]